MMRLPYSPSRRSPTQLGRLCRVASILRIVPSALFLVARLTGLAGNILLLLTGLRLPALLLLLTGLLVGCLFRLWSMVRIIHLSTSFRLGFKFQHEVI